MTKYKRKIAIFLSIMLCFVILTCLTFIAKMSQHECTQEECSICCQISFSKKMLKRLGSTVLSTAVTMVFAALTVLLPHFFYQMRQNATLVSLKVKLSN